MAVRFLKIAHGAVDPRRVTLRIFLGNDGAIYGRVSTLAFGKTGVELMSTERADPPILAALELARNLATFKEEDVDVLDDDNLWQDTWADLDGL